MPGFWRVTVVYALGLILTEALVLLVSGIAFRSGAALFYAGCLVISLLIPALVAGMSFGRHTGRAAAPPEAWRFALWFASIQGVLFAQLLWLAMQEFLAEESDGVVIFAVVLFVYSAIALFISRFFFGFGARQGARMRVSR
ncbi:MAG: ABZJ_00895 family protein [Albidovulum sp.]